MSDEVREVCGLCNTGVGRTDLARGRKLSICRACVERGLAHTLEATRTQRDGEIAPRAYRDCSMCGERTPPPALYHADEKSVCATCLYESYNLLTQLLELTARRRSHYPPGKDRMVATLLERHFQGLGATDIVSASREFPRYLHADLQRALDGLLAGRDGTCVGFKAQYSHETLAYASLLQRDHSPVSVAPLQYEDVDVGEREPVRCARNGLWLMTDCDVRYALVLTPAYKYGQTHGWHVEIAVPAGAEGERLARHTFRSLEDAIKASASYRGKVLSLEAEPHYAGMAAGNLVVQRLEPVAREDIILPGRTLELLERNVFNFLAQRKRLQALRMPVKKGLLFYGPPGTGKTHTIRYLAGALEHHTTLLVTAEQCGILPEYLALARLLSPAVVVIEDVDLIAREREHLQTPGQESLLNRLLNEMDGLRENAEVLFILTTNHPQALERALAGRPGRIDQAVEFPLPDAEGRRRLVDLYRRDLGVAADLAAQIVERTEGVSAAFVKELMRRAAQFAFERSADTTEALLEDVEQALRELLFEGGKLNATLLGARVVESST